MESIRKISVGADYKNGAMHYIVGQDVLNGTHKINCIRLNNDTSNYEVWIESGDEVRKWKAFNENMPVSIEYDIDF